MEFSTGTTPCSASPRSTLAKTSATVVWGWSSMLGPNERRAASGANVRLGARSGPPLAGPAPRGDGRGVRRRGLELDARAERAEGRLVGERGLGAQVRHLQARLKGDGGRDDLAKDRLQATPGEAAVAERGYPVEDPPLPGTRVDREALALLRGPPRRTRGRGAGSPGRGPAAPWQARRRRGPRAA